MTSLDTLPVRTDQDHERDAPRSVVAALARMLIAPAVGVAVALLLLMKLVLPAIGVGSVQRIVDLGRHLEAPFPAGSTVAFLGNSITREGIDAAIVEAVASGGWRAENLAMSGCGPSELRVLLPKLLAAKPTAVVLAFRPEDLGEVDGFALDKAYAYALGGFVTAWPSDWNQASLPGVNDATYQALRSSPLDQQLHFRTALLNTINQEVRLRFRRGLRKTAPDNWVDPYELLFTIRDQRLDRHADTIRAEMQVKLAAGTVAGSALVGELAHAVHDQGAMPILVVLPLHPLLREGMQKPLDELRSLLDRLAAEQGGLALDASDVLSAEDFADVLHPNDRGREIYSRFVGEHLPAIPVARPARALSSAAQ